VTLDRLWQLDATNAASNSNFAGANIAENCAPSGINNALRALGVMAARELAFQAAAISASVSTNIVTSSTGLFVPISGANAINSFGVVPGEQPSAAVFRFLQFSSSASLSHGGSIFLEGGASRRTQPGDIGGYIHAGSGDTWFELFYNRATGSLPMDSLSVTTITNRSMSTSAISTVTLNAVSASITGLAFTTINATSVSASVGAFGILKYGSTQLSEVYVQTKTASSAASASTATTIPFDTSIPQNSEGANIFSVSITPRNASSIIEIEGVLYMEAANGAGVELIAALFLDNAASAIFAASTEAVSNGVVALPFTHEHTASTTSEHIYALRYGADTGSARLNTGSGNNLGGVMRSWLRVKERLP
jgi:hypothetical protein